MDAAHDLAEQDTDELRQEMDCTRSDMADKLEALEDRVMDTVQSARETVAESIRIAKDTVDTVKRTFDVKHHVEQHPWPLVGGCFLAGLALGSLFPRVRQRSRQTPDRPAEKEVPLSGSPPFPAEQRSNGSFATAAPPPRFPAVPPSRPGVFGKFQEEIDKVQGMAIGYVMGRIRDSLKESVPQLAAQIDGVMNGVTMKLGAAPAQPH
jgi:ElaB/YqjD/DUF883 family membrane-anchored ribosome-binding protein